MLGVFYLFNSTKNVIEKCEPVKPDQLLQFFHKVSATLYIGLPHDDEYPLSETEIVIPLSNATSLHNRLSVLKFWEELWRVF